MSICLRISTILLLVVHVLIFMVIPTLALDKTVCGIHIGTNDYTWREAVELLPSSYFDYLERLSANWVGITIELYVDDSLDSTVGIIRDGFGQQTYTDEKLRELVGELKRRGFRVYWTLAFVQHQDGEPGKQVRRSHFGNPYAYETGFQSYRISQEYWPWAPGYPGHAEFVAEFFRTYTDWAVHFASLAEELGVDMFSLGTETNWLFRTRPEPPRFPEAYLQELRQMVSSVRSVYGGLLTYDQSWHCALYGPPGYEFLWEDLGLDVVGLSAYYILTHPHPQDLPYSTERLEQEWKRVFADYLVPLREMYPELPIVFLEFGCTDVPGGASRPVNSSTRMRYLRDVDRNGLDDGEEEQANYYQALFTIMEESPGILNGLFSWREPIAPYSMWYHVGVCRRGTGIRSKLSEAVVREFFSAHTSRLPSTVCPDSHLSNSYDWQATTHLLDFDLAKPPLHTCDYTTELPEEPQGSSLKGTIDSVQVGVAGESLLVEVVSSVSSSPDPHGYSVLIDPGTGVKAEVVIRPYEKCVELLRVLDQTSVHWRYFCDSCISVRGTSVRAVVPLGSILDILGPAQGSQWEFTVGLESLNCKCCERYVFHKAKSLWVEFDGEDYTSRVIEEASQLQNRHFGQRLELCEEPSWIVYNGRVIPLEEALYWKSPGSGPKWIELQLGDDSLAVALQLPENEAFGQFQYGIRLKGRSGEITIVWLDPSSRSARVEVRYLGRKSVSESVHAPLTYFGASFVSARIPTSLIATVIDVQKLAGAEVTLLVNISRENSYETYGFYEPSMVLAKSDK